MWTWCWLIFERHPWLSALVSVLVAVVICWVIKKFREKSDGDAPGHTDSETNLRQIPSGRMRKRDLVRYYGHRMIRKAGIELRHLRRRPRERVVNIAKKLLQGPDIPERQLYKEPPEAFLEADYLEGDTNLPSEVLYLLRSVKAFGHFEKPLFMELCKHVETKFVPSGALLFKPGLQDDSIYVVKNGCLRVYVLEPDGTELPLKEAHAGDSVHSMLSILDVVTGHSKPFKTVAARATRDTYVLQVNGHGFEDFFSENPDSMLRMVQIIMLRLQRVTFLALNQVLGLGKELLNQKPNLLLDHYAVNKLKPVIKPDNMDHVIATVECEPQQQFQSYFSNSRQHLQSLDSDEDSSSTVNTKQKMVAIDTTQNRHFTHRLLPVHSPEFDNVIDQARVDRQEFSADTGHDEVRSSTSPHAVRVTADSFTSEVLKAAMVDLVQIFQLKDESLLKGRIQHIEVPANALLGLEGDLDSCVYFVAVGRLKVFRSADGESSSYSQANNLLYVAYPGEFCGVLSALTGEPSFITIIAGVDSHLVAITKTNLYHIMSECPQAICGLAYDLVQRLSPLVRQMDFALDWMELEAGRALYRQGDEAASAYIILNGRVRSVIRKSEGKKELVDEYGRGETIGLVEVMTNSACATTVHAIRDTEVACLPSGLLATIKLKQPQVVSRLIQVLGERILGSYHRPESPLSQAALAGYHAEGLLEAKKHMSSNLSTVAVVPITQDVPLNNFTRMLCEAINTIAPSTRLTSDLVQKELGSSALESIHEYRLRTWLGHQEDTHRLVIYQADQDVSPWTARCIRQADCILLVGLAEKTPSDSMAHIVKQVESISMRVQKELVLLHQETSLHPVGTVKWLNALGWLSSHFHVRCPSIMFSSEDFGPIEADRHSDCARLARRLTGTSVGLVLGGGGARGIAHVGVIKALTEAGVPIDMVAGTSIGAFVGALYCEERESRNVETRAREWSKKMAGVANKIFDLTYPTTSMFTGHSFNALIRGVFGEKQIEDLWLPYYCVTTDITESNMRVHSSGNLWRYVRASMSLSGYLPPLCDPVDGHLLLDGGYVNNLPADVISVRGAETVIAVDVGSVDNNDLTNYGDAISGWYLLWNKLNPFATKVRVPNLSEIQSRLAYVSCIRQLEMVKSNGMCEYMRLPIDSIGTLQFGSFENILPIGYQYCRKMIDTWQSNQRMKQLLNPQTYEAKNKHLHLMKKFDEMCKQNSSSVKDLAKLATQLAIQKHVGEDDVDSGGYWSNPEDHISQGVTDSTESIPQAVFALSDSELT